MSDDDVYIADDIELPKRDESFAATRPTSREIRFSPTPAQMSSINVFCPDCPLDTPFHLMVTAVTRQDPIPHLECPNCRGEFELPMVQLTRRDAIDGG